MSVTKQAQPTAFRFEQLRVNVADFIHFSSKISLLCDCFSYLYRRYYLGIVDDKSLVHGDFGLFYAFQTGKCGFYNPDSPTSR